MSNVVRLDDYDPRIQYSGSWFFGGGPWEYNGYVQLFMEQNLLTRLPDRSTTHGTLSNDDSFSVTFNGTLATLTPLAPTHCQRE